MCEYFVSYYKFYLAHISPLLFAEIVDAELGPRHLPNLELLDNSFDFDAMLAVAKKSLFMANTSVLGSAIGLFQRNF
jgi:hypothetical protein